MNPGIYDHLSNADYHAALGISKSGLDLIDRSPAHYAARYLDGIKAEPTPAMAFGTAFHAAVLEPELFERNYVVSPDVRRCTKAWNAFELANHGKELIKPKEYEQIRGMVDAVYKHSFARILLTGGQAERSVFWEHIESGVLCKCRPDYWRDAGTLVDLKSVADASQAAFEKSALNFRYHVQAAFYLNGTQIATHSKQSEFCFIAVEKEPPYLVAVYVTSKEMLAIGYQKYWENIQRYAECLQKKDWPGYPEEVQIINLPRWAA